MRRLHALFVLAFLIAIPAGATTVAGNVTNIAGEVVPNVSVRVQVQNCGSYIVRGAIVYGVLDKVLPIDGNGAFTVALPDETTLQCGSTAASAFYRFCVVTLDPVTHKVATTLGCNDYDITGSSPLNLKDLVPRSAPAPAAIANALLLNPSGAQTVLGGFAVTFTGVVNVTGRCNGCVSSGLDFSFNVEFPAVVDSGKFQHKLNQVGTVDRISCSTDTGTVAINLDVRSEATPNTAGTAALASPLSCTSTTAVASSFSNATLSANAPIALTISSVSGASLLRVHIHFKP